MWMLRTSRGKFVASRVDNETSRLSNSLTVLFCPHLTNSRALSNYICIESYKAVPYAPVVFNKDDIGPPPNVVRAFLRLTMLIESRLLLWSNSLSVIRCSPICEAFSILPNSKTFARWMPRGTGWFVPPLKLPQEECLSAMMSSRRPSAFSSCTIVFIFASSDMGDLGSRSLSCKAE